MSKSHDEPQPDHTPDEPAAQAMLVDPLPFDPAPLQARFLELLRVMGDMLTILEVGISFIPSAHNLAPRLAAVRAALTALSAQVSTPDE